MIHYVTQAEMVKASKAAKAILINAMCGSGMEPIIYPYKSLRLQAVLTVKEFRSALGELVWRGIAVPFVRDGEALLWFDCVTTPDIGLPWEKRERSAKAKRSLSITKRQKVLNRDGELCAYCGDTEGPFHIDHIHPKSRGGDNSMGNLTVACAPCNMSKGAKLIGEWEGR